MKATNSQYMSRIFLISKFMFLSKRPAHTFSSTSETSKWVDEKKNPEKCCRRVDMESSKIFQYLRFDVRVRVVEAKTIFVVSLLNVWTREWNFSTEKDENQILKSSDEHASQLSPIPPSNLSYYTNNLYSSSRSPTTSTAADFSTRCLLSHFFFSSCRQRRRDWSEKQKEEIWKFFRAANFVVAAFESSSCLLCLNTERCSAFYHF